MTSEEINAGISALDEATGISPMSNGKAVPYYGWFWRSVDFDRPIRFAYADGGGFDVPSWVGFCENNKWGYEEFTATDDQSAEVRRLSEALVSSKTAEAARALYEYLQSIRPPHVTGKKRWED